jgi:hypothetical protein
MDGTWYVVYAGRCSSFCDRMPLHERWAEAVACGATHVLARYNPDPRVSELEERDIVAALRPPLNKQLQPV